MNYIPGLLQKPNYQFLEAKNGAETLKTLEAYLEKSTLQHIISDVMMPVEQKTTSISPKDLIWLADVEKIVTKVMVQFDFIAERVAEQLYMSRSSFFIKLKRLSGITPTEYVQKRRLSQARHGLETSLYSTVKEAAISVGFKDVRYFSELFRKCYGNLPSHYL
jgi:AraC-like DNA-binding protein